MSQRTNYLLKNMGILAISNFATKFLTVFLVPLYTGILTTTEYGIFDLVSTSVGLLLPILTLNITDAIMRFSLEQSWSKSDIGRIGVKYVLYSSAIVFIGLLFAYWLNIVPSINQYCGYFFLYYFCSAMTSFLSQYAKGCEKVKTIGIAGVIGTVLTVALNILFLVVVKIGLHGFFLASILSQGAVVIYYGASLGLIEKIRTGQRNKALEQQMLKYSAPLVSVTIGWWVNSAADKYVVSYLCGVDSNGILAVSYKLPTIMNSLQNIFTQAWQISAVKEYGSEDTGLFYGETFKRANLIMCAACSWLILLSIPVSSVLFAKEFFAAWQYAPFLLISSVINNASGMLGPILSAKKMTKPIALSAIYGAGANIIMNIAFVYLIGVQGATIATVISSFIIYAVRKRAVAGDIRIDGYGVVLITWVLLCVQAVIEIYTTFWWTEIILMIVMLALNRKGIAEMFEKIVTTIQKRLKV